MKRRLGGKTCGIPSTLKIGGHTYKVLKNYHFSQNTNLCAQAGHDEMEIRISGLTLSGKLRPRSTLEESFLHEILHCVDLVYNNAKLDENTISNLSQGLYQVLKDSGICFRR